MKRAHLLRVEGAPQDFGPLLAAARPLRLGWLELDGAAAGPADLEGAAAAGVLRAVSVGGGRVVSVKPLRGEPVLRDLLREHFRGCVAVLVRGAVEAPLLEPRPDGWRLVLPDGSTRSRSTDELLADLRRPRPWG